MSRAACAAVGIGAFWGLRGPQAYSRRCRALVLWGFGVNPEIEQQEATATAGPPQSSQNC